jgi:methionine-gamma-lyase
MRLPHLGLRMKEHSRRALIFAERLDELGLNVVYPGLPSHPQHDLFRELGNPDYGFGGLFTLDVGDPSRAEVFMDVLQNRDRFGYMAVSLGYHHTLMSCSAASTASELTDEELKVAGIQPGLIRFSLGYTGGLEQRWEQFAEALKSVGITSSK